MGIRTATPNALYFLLQVYESPRRAVVTLEEDVAQWARIEAARRDTSVSRLLGELLKDRMSSGKGSPSDAVERLETFGKRHKLSLRELKIKDLISEGRR